MDKPEALWLADIVERNIMFQETAREAAAELRRLHELNVDKTEIIAAISAQRDALLEALKMMRVKYGEYACRVCARADAAIAKAEGQT